MISPAPIRAATISPRTRIGRSSSVSPAPSDLAVKASVLMRRKPNSQNRQSKITDATATPPSSVASPSLPIAIVETMPISGVVRLATIAGPAMANTCAVETLDTEFNETGLRAELSSARGAEHSRQQPDRYHDHGAEQEVAPQPVDGVKAEIPDPLKQKPDAVDDIPGVEANSGKHHPDQDRQQDQPKCHRQRRASEKAVQAIVGGRRQFPCIVWHSMIPRTISLAHYSRCWGDGEPACRRQ